MSKQEFLARLRDGLNGLPQDDIAERLDYYSEMIDDRIEEGLTEDEAVAAIGAVDVIVPQIVSEIPLPKLVRESVRPKRQLAGWEIALLVIGSPVWNGSLSCPINTVLAETDLKGKALTFLLYSGSGGAPKAEQKIKERFPDARIVHLKEPKKNPDELKKL